MNDSFQTPHKRTNINEILTDQRYKYSTIESKVEKNSRFFKGNSLLM